MTTGLRRHDIDAAMVTDVGPFLVPLLSDPVDITPSGYSVSEPWAPVAGATGARVERATLRVRPDTDGSPRSLGLLLGARDNVTDISLDVGRDDLPIRGVRIPNLNRPGEDGNPQPVSVDTDHRLIVAPIVNGQRQAPFFAVPAFGGGDPLLPAQLAGASWSGSYLTLPDLVGRHFRISLVDGDTLDAMTPLAFNHGDITVYAAPGPTGRHVLDGAGAAAYAQAGALPRALDYDLTAATNRHVAAKARTGEPFSVGARLRSDVTGLARIGWQLTGATIERAIDGRLTAEAQGRATSISVPAPDPGRPPRRTVADVTITHAGMALHPASDPAPGTDADLGGLAVGAVPRTRALPPEALRGQLLRRVAVIGWPSGTADLTLTVADRSATVTGLQTPIGRSAPQLVWFDIGSLPVEEPLEVGLVATRGGFGWVAAPDPLLQFAVSAGPIGERVRVGGRVITLTGPETVVTGCELAGHGRWLIDSDQFATVTLSSTVLEFDP